jgi:hypothetical protein
VGRTVTKGTLGFLKVRATDPHGYYIDTYLTIKIYDYVPLRRTSGRIAIFKETIEVLEETRYSFRLPDDMLYDPQDKSPLVFQVSDPDDLPLPGWIKFEPVEKIFFGFAPSAP